MHGQWVVCARGAGTHPTLALRLGRDMPAEFPAALGQLGHRALQTGLARIDPTPGGGTLLASCDGMVYDTAAITVST